MDWTDSGIAGGIGSGITGVAMWLNGRRSSKETKQRGPVDDYQHLTDAQRQTYEGLLTAVQAQATAVQAQATALSAEVAELRAELATTRAELKAARQEIGRMNLLLIEHDIAVPTGTQPSTTTTTTVHTEIQHEGH